jgi:hypothetical protein
VTQRYPDTEAAVKAAAKAALPELAGRVFYAVPKGNPTLPLLTVAHISGGPDDGEAPLDVPRLTFSCWGKNKEDASNLRLALVGWLRSLNSVMLDPTTFCYGVTGIFITWQPDDQLARYVVDATFSVAYRD